MSLSLRTYMGSTEAVIADNGSLQLFYQLARLLEEHFHLKFLSKEDEFDSINWDFRYQGSMLSLQYNIYSGISLMPTRIPGASYKDNKAVMELAASIEKQMPQWEALQTVA